MFAYLYRLIKSYFVDNIPDPKIGEYWAFCVDFNNPFNEFSGRLIKDTKDGYVLFGNNETLSIRSFKCMYRKVEK